MARRSVRVDGRALERLRLAGGYGRQGDLAEAAGVSQSTVSRAENGSKETMLEASAHQLAAALGVDLTALLAEPAIQLATDDADVLAARMAPRLAELLLPELLRALAGQAGQGRGGQRRQGTVKPKTPNQAGPAHVEAYLAGALAS